MSSGASLPRFVLDASIAIKWYLNDEDHVVDALAVQADFTTGRILLVAPDHIRYEVTNALRTAERRGRLTALQAHTAARNFLAVSIPTVNDDTLLISGLTYALRYDCALYDGLYLALADIADAPFLHADVRLRNTLQGRFARERWIDSLG